MSTVAHRPRRGYRTLRLPLSEADYERFMNEGEFAKVPLDELYERHPELFPVDFVHIDLGQDHIGVLLRGGFVDCLYTGSCIWRNNLS